MIVTMIDGVTLQYGMLDLDPGSHLLGSAHMVWPILATQIMAIARLEIYVQYDTEKTAGYCEVNKTIKNWRSFYQHGSTLIPAWTNDYIHCKGWDEITYLFPNFNIAGFED